jgi:GDPmannose 4,6-dehydratase
VDLLLGDPTKARERLGWKHKVSFEELITEMVHADFEELRRERQPPTAARAALRAVP